MSTTPAILVQGLGKCYPIASSESQGGRARSSLLSRARRLLPSMASGAPADGFWALRDASFRIDRGENVGVIGLNGAGKSTLLKILSRIVEPSTGTARIDGRVGALLEVGTGFQRELSGRDNIYLYGSILGMRRHEVARNFDAIVEFSGVGKHIDVPVKQYSSGMYVRLGFAVAAHLEPEILFLDEVLAVGDLSFQRKCIEFTKGLQRRESTILFVSHNMFSIKSMCERVIYLRNGRVEFDGSVEKGIELYERDCRLSVVGWEGAGHPDRWPVFIDRCEVLGAEGKPKTVFELGERMVIRLDYSIREPLSDPNFMISIVRSDGVVCCTYSTEADGMSLGTLRKDGTIELDIPAARLVAEMYSVNVTVRKKGFQDIVCAQIGTTFHVRDDLLSHHFGVFHEPGTWRGDALPRSTLATKSRRPLAAARD